MYDRSTRLNLLRGRCTMKRAVLTDSTANIGEELYNHPDVFQADLLVEFDDGETFTDTWDEEKIKEFYDKMRKSKTLPTTSQPSPHQFSQAYQSIIDQGYESVIVITIAKGVSGTFQNASITAKDFSDQLDITAISSGSGAYGARNMVEHILKWYEQDLSNEAIFEKLDILRDETRVYGAIHDLTNIRKGGRVSHLGGSVAGALKVAAVFNVKHDELGLEKVTLGKKSVRRAMDKVLEKLVEKNKGRKYRLAILHSNAHKVAEEKTLEFREKYHNALEVVTDNLTIVLGTQLGEDVLAYVYMPYLD